MRWHYDAPHYEYHFDDSAFRHRVYNGWGNPKPETELVMGPNITDWPAMYPLSENILLELAAVIRDEVTTTDELIPSGETSSLPFQSGAAGGVLRSPGGCRIMCPGPNALPPGNRRAATARRSRSCRPG